MKKKAVFNWSGGKDSAHALWRALRSDEFDIVALLTTLNRDTHRSTMHDIPEELLRIQSQSIGIPLKILALKPGGNMDDYNQSMQQAVEEFKQQGVTHFIFGDISLHDVRRYREAALQPYGIEVVEPLWGPSSQQIINDFLDSGLKTVVVTTMADGLGAEAIGKEINREFIQQLPVGTDPNGENGEYHTFCYDGPSVSFPGPYSLGEPRQKSFDIKLDNGTTQTFTYCFANLSVAP